MFHEARLRRHDPAQPNAEYGWPELCHEIERNTDMGIRIRHVEATDAADVKAILADTSVMLGTMRLPYVADAGIATRIAPKDGLSKLVAEIEGRVVGFSIMTTFPDIPRHNHVGEIDLVAVHGEFQGRGVAKALLGAQLDLADNWLQLDRTSLLVWTHNTRAIALYEAFGFEAEGVIRRYARIPGGYADACVMGRIPDLATRTGDLSAETGALSPAA